MGSFLRVNREMAIFDYERGSIVSRLPMTIANRLERQDILKREQTLHIINSPADVTVSFVLVFFGFVLFFAFITNERRRQTRPAFQTDSSKRILFERIENSLTKI